MKGEITFNFILVLIIFLAILIFAIAFIGSTEEGVKYSANSLINLFSK